MPLKVSLKPNEKVIVNGAVLQNGEHAATLVVLNEAALLRDKDILTEENSNTPARRIYYTLQCAYLFPDNRKPYLDLFYQYLTEFEVAVPSSAELVGKVRSEVDGGRYYQGLRKSRRLIDHEKEILNAFASPRI